MICKECNTELEGRRGEDGGVDTFYLAKDFKLFEMINKFKIPFYCESCGSLKFPYKAARDVVFIWPEVTKEKIGSIYIPETVNILTEYGVVLTAGPGHRDTKKGIFYPSQLSVGDVIVYDKGVPWSMEVVGTDGKTYNVKYMGEQDVKGIVKDDSDSTDNS